MGPKVEKGNKKVEQMIWDNGVLAADSPACDTLDPRVSSNSTDTNRYPKTDSACTTYSPALRDRKNQKEALNNNNRNDLVISKENSTPVEEFLNKDENAIRFTVDADLGDSICSNSTSSNEVKKPKVPDGGWGWVVVFASFVISMIADGISFSFGLLYIEFLSYFQETKSKTSWIGSLFMSVPLLSGPVMSALVDRYGCRKMTMLGGLISGLGFVLASLGKSIEWELIFFGVVAGIGLGLCYVTAVVCIAYWFDKYRNLAVGLGACGTGVGTFIYAPMTQYFVGEYGWRRTVLLLAGSFFNMCVCGAVMRDPKWWTLEQIKQNSVKSLKNDSSWESIGGIHGESTFFKKQSIKTLLKDGRSSEYILTKLVTKIEKSRNSVEKCGDEADFGLSTARSVVNLPTFIKQNEKVPLEVLEQLSSNRTLFNVILENYPSLLHCRSLSDERKLSQISTENKPLPVTMSMKLKKSRKEETSGPAPTVLETEVSPKAARGDIFRRDLFQNPTLCSNGKLPSPGKRHVSYKDSCQHYLRDIRLHRNSVMYRGAMLNIPRYRLRASSCPSILRNSMTTIAKENEEKWYADALELFKTMFDFSMFVELHFLLMSLATILLFTWFIVPYFYLAEHLTRHGYNEVEGSFLLSIIGVTNCIGMVGLGWAGDQAWMNVTKTYAACLVLCGLSCILMPLITESYNLLAATSALFGLFFASNYSFTPSILVQLIPLERFTTAYGLTLLCQGIGNLVGPPLAGWIFDVTGEWDLSFYMAGAWIIFSGILIILIQCTKNRKVWGSGALEMDKISNAKLNLN